MSSGSGSGWRRGGMQSRLERRFVSKPPTPVRAAAYIAGAAFSVAVIAGAIAHWLDDGIPSLWLGIYWAVQTVTTVGYGKPTPTGTVGQVLALLLMLLGTAFVAVITAAVTSVFIERARAIHEAEDDAAKGPTLDDIDARLERIEQLLRSTSS